MQWPGRTLLGMRWCEDLQKLEDSVKAVTQGSDWVLNWTARHGSAQRRAATGSKTGLGGCV